jgi:hypothetical protein
MTKIGLKVMFVGASRIPTEKVREELYGDVPEGRRWVRTFGSLLSHPGAVGADVVVFDEVCMEHAAELYVALWMLKPKQFWCCGDFKQMFYVPFLAGYVPKYASIAEYADIAMLIRGHRVPKDVYAAGLEVYGRESGIHPCSCSEHQHVMDSLELRKVNSIAEVPLDKSVTYLSHGQMVKERMSGIIKTQMGFTNQVVSTIAEFQGGTADAVSVVREVVAYKKGSIYHEEERANVAVSRSIGKTVYYTCSSEEDALAKMIASSKKIALRDIVEDNIRRYGNEEDFGIEMLGQFLKGTLSSEHSAVRAGRVLKEKMCGSFIKN